MYLIDADVLIDAKNRYYAFDIAPGFWQWLEHVHNKMACLSIEPVYNELTAGNDELADWAKKHRAFFPSIDPETTRHLASIAEWTTKQDFTQAAINTFLQNTADYYLVAAAKAHGHCVVTNERPDPAAKKRILIPEACKAFGVQCVSVFDMLKRTDGKQYLGAQNQSIA